MLDHLLNIGMLIFFGVLFLIAAVYLSVAVPCIGVLSFVDAITGYKAKRRRKEARQIIDYYVSIGRYTQKEADAMWNVMIS